MMPAFFRKQGRKLYWARHPGSYVSVVGASLGMGRGKPLLVRAALGGPTSGGQGNVLMNKHEKTRLRLACDCCAPKLYRQFSGMEWGVNINTQIRELF
jgi:hypothetical protein